MANERKNIWDLKRDEIVILNGHTYKFDRIVKHYMPTIGKVDNLRLVNTKNKLDKPQFFRGITIEKQEDGTWRQSS